MVLHAALLSVDTVIACAFREKKKKGGKVEPKKKSVGEKEKEGGNESFKSKEFISSEESSSESDHDKGRKRKVCDGRLSSRLYWSYVDVHRLTCFICPRLLMVMRRKHPHPPAQRSRDLTDDH